MKLPTGGCDVTRQSCQAVLRSGEARSELNGCTQYRDDVPPGHNRLGPTEQRRTRAAST